MGTSGEPSRPTRCQFCGELFTVPLYHHSYIRRYWFCFTCRPTTSREDEVELILATVKCVQRSASECEAVLPPVPRPYPYKDV